MRRWPPAGATDRAGEAGRRPSRWCRALDVRCGWGGWRQGVRAPARQGRAAPRATTRSRAGIHPPCGTRRPPVRRCWVPGSPRTMRISVAEPSRAAAMVSSTVRTVSGTPGSAEGSRLRATTSVTWLPSTAHRPGSSYVAGYENSRNSTQLAARLGRGNAQICRSGMRRKPTSEGRGCGVGRPGDRGGWAAPAAIRADGVAGRWPRPPAPRPRRGRRPPGHSTRIRPPGPGARRARNGRNEGS